MNNVKGKVLSFSTRNLHILTKFIYVCFKHFFPKKVIAIFNLDKMKCINMEKNVIVTTYVTTNPTDHEATFSLRRTLKL